MSKVNQLSKPLSKIVEDAMPKKGQTFCFVSVRPNARGTTALPYDTIYDPGAKEDVDIVYITGAAPVYGVDPGTKQPSQEMKHVRNLGRIQFGKSKGGRIYVTGGKPNDEKLFRFLFLTNQLRNNVNKEWFISKPGRQPVCVLQEPAKSAEATLSFRRMVRQAGEAIDVLTEDQLREFASGLELPGVNKNTTADEIRVHLLKIADKSPDKILALDKDVTLRIKIDIKEAERLGIISFDDALSTYTWPDTGDQICVVPPNTKRADVITQYFLGKGSAVYETIRKLILKKKEKPEKEK